MPAATTALRQLAGWNPEVQTESNESQVSHPLQPEQSWAPRMVSGETVDLMPLLLTWETRREERKRREKAGEGRAKMASEDGERR